MSHKKSFEMAQYWKIYNPQRLHVIHWNASMFFGFLSFFFVKENTPSNCVHFNLWKDFECPNTVETSTISNKFIRFHQIMSNSFWFFVIFVYAPCLIRKCANLNILTSRIGSRPQKVETTKTSGKQIRFIRILLTCWFHLYVLFFISAYNVSSSAHLSQFMNMVLKLLLMLNEYFNSQLCEIRQRIIRKSHCFSVF